MKKQGMPAPLDESKVTLYGGAGKRKTADAETESAAPALKKRRSGGKDKPIGKKAKVETKKPAKPSKKVPLPESDSESDAGVEGLSDLDDEELELDSDELGANDDDSVMDSDEEKTGRMMWSEDEDESDAEEKLTAANIAGLSAKLDAEKAEEEAAAQAELEENAIQTNIAGDRPDVFGGEDDAISMQLKAGMAPDLQLLRTRITDTIRILGDFAKLGAEGKSRTDYTNLLLDDICTYYGYTPYLAEKLLSLFTPLEAFAFFEANETPRPVVIRANTLKTNRRTLAQALINRGVVLEPVGKWSKVGLQIFESAVPLGATPEYLAGHYILQAASSFLPVMALAPQPDERVLDMAAAPGGKTTYISALMRNTGCVIANDANRQRAKGLIGNIHRLGCKNTIVSNLDARTGFPKVLGGFDRVLLDAPCSGTGVIAKDSSVKTSKTERDFLALPHMQKQLLLSAIDSVNHESTTGGYIVYSTCSVTVEENESVVQYVLRKRPNVKLVDTGLGSFGSEGFKSYQGKHFDEKMNLTRRYFPHRENVDGFFVCKLKKTGPSPADGSGRMPDGVMKPVKKDDEEDEVLIDKAPIGTDTDAGNTTAEGEEDGFDFDEEEDEKFIEAAKRNKMRKKGINPKADPSRKTSKNGEVNGKKEKTVEKVTEVTEKKEDTKEKKSKKEKKDKKEKKAPK